MIYDGVTEYDVKPASGKKLLLVNDAVKQAEWNFTVCVVQTDFLCEKGNILVTKPGEPHEKSIILKFHVKTPQGFFCDSRTQ